MKHHYLLYSCVALCLGLRAGASHAQSPVTSPYVAVECANAGGYTLALRADGSLWAWGENRFGQLGYATPNVETSKIPRPVTTPTTVPPGTTWAQLAPAANGALALRSDGSLWAWGQNWGLYGNGQINMGANFMPTAIPHPTTAAPGTVWTQLDAGGGFAVALRSDNTLWSWGNNAYGQLGDGTTTDRAAPVRIPTPATAAPGTRWTSVSCHWASCLALRSDGSLWGWGYNYFGQLGVNTNQGTFAPVPMTQIPTPAAAAPGTTWTRIVAGTDHTLAMRSDGSLWIWGNNKTGNYTMQPVPVPATAPASARWVDFAGGKIASGALLSDGTLWMWGDNMRGQLGLNHDFTQNTLRQEYTQSQWSKVIMGNEFSLALDVKGQLYSTGINTTGQLGDGSNAGRLTFKPVLDPLLAATAPRLLPAPQPWPNPAHDYLTVPNLAPAATVRLHDAQGRLVRDTRPTAGQVDVRGLSPGLYLLTVQEPGQASRAARVVLE